VFDEALSRAGLPQSLDDGPLSWENAQTGERLTVRVETECCQYFTSKVSKKLNYEKCDLNFFETISEK
jgi:hypothetical protein